jgi:hypothetical protein
MILRAAQLKYLGLKTKPRSYPTVANCTSARRRGGRVAECGGGLLNLPRLIRSNLPNNLQLGASALK